MKYRKTTVLENRVLGSGHGLLMLEVPETLPEIKAGQFLTLRCDPVDKFSLMRPFSILYASAMDDRISVYYKGLGRMSNYLFHIKPGTQLDCLYPLGKGYPWLSDWRRVALVGGGVGLAPLLYMARQLEPYGDTMRVVGYFGGATAEDLVPELLKDYELPVKTATMDGSAGFHGTVVDLFAREDDYFDVIYTCGPNAMMAALKRVVPEGCEAFARLEEYMACGVGACYGCTARIIDKSGQERNQRICCDGPVFDMRSVVFE